MTYNPNWDYHLQVPTAESPTARHLVIIESKLWNEKHATFATQLSTRKAATFENHLNPGQIAKEIGFIAYGQNKRAVIPYQNTTTLDRYTLSVAAYDILTDLRKHAKKPYVRAATKDLTAQGYRRCLHIARALNEDETSLYLAREHFTAWENEMRIDLTGGAGTPLPGIDHTTAG